MDTLVTDSIRQHQRLADKVCNTLVPKISRVADILIEVVESGNTIFWCGNGGSAADSQHLAAELIGRFKSERRAIASVALTTDTSVLTCLGNDYGYDTIFSRQVSGLARQGDVLMCISTSGNSPNVVEAARVAIAKSVVTVALCGGDGGVLASLCDERVIVPDSDTARVQEMHILIGHILCDLIERSVVAD